MLKMQAMSIMINKSIYTVVNYKPIYKLLKFTIRICLKNSFEPAKARIS